jgi:hypothetical protein
VIASTAAQQAGQMREHQFARLFRLAGEDGSDDVAMFVRAGTLVEALGSGQREFIVERVSRARIIFVSSALPHSSATFHMDQTKSWTARWCGS